MFISTHLTAAQPHTITVHLRKTFSYPNPTTYIVDIGKINEAGDIVGTLEKDKNAVGTFLGFERTAGGRFSPPILGPVGRYAETLGISNTGVISGTYANRTSSHGMLISAGSVTTYDAPGAHDTSIFTIKDNGDFGGGYSIDGSGMFSPFLNIGGTFIAIPLAGGGVVDDINNLGLAMGEANHYMFLREADGTLTYPIDAPGSPPFFYPKAINDSEVIVGGANFVGFIWEYPDTYVTYSVPRSTYTEITGINNAGLICGRYEVSPGVFRGFIAQVTIK